MSELKQLAQQIFRDTLAAVDIADTMQRKLALVGSVLLVDSMHGGAGVGFRVCGAGKGAAPEIVVNLADYERIRVVAIGKASIEMAQGLARVLAPDVKLEGIVAAPHA
ncbi:MAG TPA: DUF4147 domain-containing protein, partial [Candidatus Acidoferrales bacterium]